MKSRGFSLIELLITVAIVGVLAGVALPLYQDYIARTQVSRAVFELSGLRESVEDSLNSGDIPSSGSDIGFSGSTLFSSSGADGITVEYLSGGQIVLSATLGGSSSLAIKGAVASLSRSTDGTWSCAIDSSASASWKDSYLPSGCSVK